MYILEKLFQPLSTIKRNVVTNVGTIFFSFFFFAKNNKNTRILLIIITHFVLTIKAVAHPPTEHFKLNSLDMAIWGAAPLVEHFHSPPPFVLLPRHYTYTQTLWPFLYLPCHFTLAFFAYRLRGNNSTMPM